MTAMNLHFYYTNKNISNVVYEKMIGIKIREAVLRSLTSFDADVPFARTFCAPLAEAPKEFCWKNSALLSALDDREPHDPVRVFINVVDDNFSLFAGKRIECRFQRKSTLSQIAKTVDDRHCVLRQVLKYDDTAAIRHCIQSSGPVFHLVNESRAISIMGWNSRGDWIDREGNAVVKNAAIDFCVVHPVVESKTIEHFSLDYLYTPQNSVVTKDSRILITVCIVVFVVLFGYWLS